MPFYIASARRVVAQNATLIVEADDEDTAFEAAGDKINAIPADAWEDVDPYRSDDEGEIMDAEPIDDDLVSEDDRGRIASSGFAATMPDVTAGEIEAVAIAFFERVVRAFTEDELTECRRRNAAETDRHVCHTHDFCDANMLMHDAFTALGISTENLGDDNSRTALWNRAWNRARDWLGGRRAR